MVTAFPDVVVRPFHKEVEFIVLACDGIWDCKESEEVVKHFKDILPVNGQDVKNIQKCNHSLLDEICPDTFDEMRQNDGIGSDNMTMIIVDFLQNSGGCNGKPSLRASTKRVEPGQSGMGGHMGAGKGSKGRR